jgi:hypothetical protein
MALATVKAKPAVALMRAILDCPSAQSGIRWRH